MKASNYAFAIGVLACLPQLVAAQEVIVLRSGQSGGEPGVEGDLDDSVTCTFSPGSLPLSADEFDAVDFAAAQTNPARVVEDVPWNTEVLACDDDARWIRHDLPEPLDFASALYAIPFEVETAGDPLGVIQVCYAVDDRLGDQAGPNFDGVYLNGEGVPGFTGGTHSIQSVHAEAVQLKTGQNWLYFYVRDTAGVISGLNFRARIEVDAPGTCRNAPGGLVGWWSMDDADQATVADFAAGRDATPFGVLGGLNGTPGAVGDALHLTGANGGLTVADDDALDFALSDFSIDAWIRPMGPPDPTVGVATIVDKLFADIPGQTQGAGYYFGIMDEGDGTYRLMLTLADGSTVPQTYISQVTSPYGEWRLAVATVDRDQVVRFFVDGFLADTFPADPSLGLLSNGLDLRIGHAGISQWIPTVYVLDGWIDELELFDRALGELDVQRLWLAGLDGKCKHDCNQNGVLDAEDIASELSLDLDGDGRPDECSDDGISSGGFTTPVSTGGSVEFVVAAGAHHAYEIYAMFGSASGIAPGVPTGAGALPLNPDGYFQFTLTQPNSSLLQDSFGLLDASGNAQATFVLPPGSPASLAGTTLHHAYVVLDLEAPELVTLVSGAVGLDLVP